MQTANRHEEKAVRDIQLRQAYLMEEFQKLKATVERLEKTLLQMGVTHEKLNEKFHANPYLSP